MPVAEPGGRGRFFGSYVASIVLRDVADASRVHDPAAVGTLLRLVAARSSSLARYDALGRDAGVDGKTARATSRCSSGLSCPGPKALAPKPR